MRGLWNGGRHSRKRSDSLFLTFWSKCFVKRLLLIQQNNSEYVLVPRPDGAVKLVVHVVDGIYIPSNNLTPYYR